MDESPVMQREGVVDVLEGEKYPRSCHHRANNHLNSNTQL